MDDAGLAYLIICRRVIDILSGHLQGSDLDAVTWKMLQARTVMFAIVMTVIVLCAWQCEAPFILWSCMLAASFI